MTMKSLVAAFSLAALAGCATPYAPQDFDFSELASGMVESVQEVQLDIHAFQEAVEHKINREPADRLLIRLDDGRAVSIVEQSAGRFAPGQRVRIVSGRVEHEYE